MISLCCKEHILPCMIIDPTIKAEHLNLIIEYHVPCLTLNTVHGQEKSKRLLKSKSSFQDFIFLRKWRIAYENIPFVRLKVKIILAIFQAASFHIKPLFRKILIKRTPFFIERTPYFLVFRQKFH